MHLKHQKHNDESEHRRSRMSSMSNSVKGGDTPRESHVRESIVQLPMASTISHNQENMNSNINGKGVSYLDFKRKPPGNFHKTLEMMSSLIGDLDGKMLKLRNERKTLVISWLIFLMFWVGDMDAVYLDRDMLLDTEFTLQVLMTSRRKWLGDRSNLLLG